MKPLLQIEVNRFKTRKGAIICRYLITKRDCFLSGPVYLGIWHNGEVVAFNTMAEAKEYCRLYLAVRKWWRKRRAGR